MKADLNDFYTCRNLLILIFTSLLSQSFLIFARLRRIGHIQKLREADILLNVQGDGDKLHHPELLPSLAKGCIFKVPYIQPFLICKTGTSSFSLKIASTVYGRGRHISSFNRQYHRRRGLSLLACHVTAEFSHLSGIQSCTYSTAHPSHACKCLIR